MGGRQGKANGIRNVPAAAVVATSPAAGDTLWSVARQGPLRSADKREDLFSNLTVTPLDTRVKGNQAPVGYERAMSVVREAAERSFGASAIEKVETRQTHIFITLKDRLMPVTIYAAASTPQIEGRSTASRSDKAVQKFHRSLETAFDKELVAFGQNKTAKRVQRLPRP